MVEYKTVKAEIETKLYSPFDRLSGRERQILLCNHDFLLSYRCKKCKVKVAYILRVVKKLIPLEWRLIDALAKAKFASVNKAYRNLFK